MVLVVIMIVMCFAGMMLASDEDDTAVLPISEEVMAYEPINQQYAREHGIGDYVLLIQAVMMQESGGRGNDPMQCSSVISTPFIPMSPVVSLIQSIPSMWAFRIWQTVCRSPSVRVPWTWML